MALFSSALASWGVEGATTTRPGIPLNIPSRLWVCWLPCPVPLPSGVRSTIGHFSCPALMNRSFEAWLTKGSLASVTKSPYMISTTGLMPSIEAPTAMPVKLSSLTGVSRTCPGWRLQRSPVTPKQPP